MIRIAFLIASVLMVVQSQAQRNDYLRWVENMRHSYHNKIIKKSSYPEAAENTVEAGRSIYHRPYQYFLFPIRKQVISAHETAPSFLLNKYHPNEWKKNRQNTIQY